MELNKTIRKNKFSAIKLFFLIDTYAFSPAMNKNLYAILKVMSILSYSSIISEANVGNMTVETEPSCQ